MICLTSAVATKPVAKEFTGGITTGSVHTSDSVFRDFLGAGRENVSGGRLSSMSAAACTYLGMLKAAEDWLQKIQNSINKIDGSVRDSQHISSLNMSSEVFQNVPIRAMRVRESAGSFVRDFEGLKADTSPQSVGICFTCTTIISHEWFLTECFSKWAGFCTNPGNARKFLRPR